MICDKIDIRRGDRVRLSPLGAARCPRLADKEGLIVGVGRYQSTVRIIFDGLKSQPRCIAIMLSLSLADAM